MLEQADVAAEHIPARIDRSGLVRDVARGLSMRQKELDPKYFYDERGSELFELITELPEYYLTRAERRLLTAEIPRLVSWMRPRSLVELGAGSATKTRVILDAMENAGSGEQYVPVDVSRAFLEESAARLRESYPELEVTTAVGDFSGELELPELVSPTLFVFLGSTIGNFEDAAAIRIIRSVAAQMRPGDRFLLGADLRKDVALIEAAYNDGAGVTAEFNLNVLRVLNRELGADFDLSAFAHRAVYNRDLDRIEMHLDSLREQSVSIPEIGEVRFARGESIRTELSCKYDRQTVESLFRRAGLRLDEWMSGDDSLFALALGQRLAASPLAVRDGDELLAGVRALFETPNDSASSLSIGAELELIPLDVETGRMVPIVSGNGRDSLSIMRRAAGRAGWTEIAGDADPPSWRLPGGGRVSFEPGGQIELSSATFETASGMIRDLQCIAQLLSSSFEREGILLDAVGVDPYNDIATVPLQLHRSRYERMASYFDWIGPSGARMMRQTASLQINLQPGPRPYERWMLLNGLAPYVTAIFANSPVYAGEATGHRSYRAHLWRTLDITRTGLAVDVDDPARGYLEFARNAGAMMHRGGAPYPSFADWMLVEELTPADWELHLTTLFPEVRPRGYFELRSADAIAPEYVAAPISFVAGLIYDEASANAAAEIMGTSDDARLEIAGRRGLDDARIHDTALQLIDVALAGSESLGDAYLSAADIDSAAEFFDRYTQRGRSPGDDRR